MSAKKRALYGASGVLFVACVYCYCRYMNDQRWVERTAREIVALSGSRDQRSQVIAVRDYVRRCVRHEGAPHDQRPFLRATARETLESGKGYCGESSRACINLLGKLGILARRINLYGQTNHVIVEVRLAEGRDILIDPQANPLTNKYFDSQDLELDSVVGSARSPFSDYSTVHLRRIPILGGIIQRVRLRYSPITWIMEDPWLIKALLAGSASIALLSLAAVDRLLIKVYAKRLGVRLVRDCDLPKSVIPPPIINIVGTSQLLIVVLATAWLVGSPEVRAQSRDEAQERMFAARLSRRAHSSARQAARPAVGGPVVQKVETVNRERSAIDTARSSVQPVSVAARPVPLATARSLGMSQATPVAPTGYGTGRDAFVESLYPQILGRNAAQSEVAYWSRALARGALPEAVAELIWKSQEHRTLVRNHEAPGIPFKVAYQTAYAAGLKNKQK